MKVIITFRKPISYKCILPTLTLKNFAFYHRQYLFGMMLKVNTDYFPNIIKNLVFMQDMKSVLCEESTQVGKMWVNMMFETCMVKIYRFKSVCELGYGVFWCVGYMVLASIKVVYFVCYHIIGRDHKYLQKHICI